MTTRLASLAAAAASYANERPVDEAWLESMGLSVAHMTRTEFRCYLTKQGKIEFHSFLGIPIDTTRGDVLRVLAALRPEAG